MRNSVKDNDKKTKKSIKDISISLSKDYINEESLDQEMTDK